MLYYCDCNVRVLVTSEEIIADLVDNEIITEEESADYKPTKAQIQDYAWKLIEADEGTYGDIVVTP